MREEGSGVALACNRVLAKVARQSRRRSRGRD